MSARKASPARAARAPSRLRLAVQAAQAAKAADRIASSRLVRTLVALATLAIAVLLIGGELRSVPLADIARAIASTPPRAIALSIAFTAATYVCESVIEWHALRFIGRPLTLGRTLLPASASSALSIAMGFGLASGTAARLRFYAFAGLGAADVAKVTALVSGALFLSGMIALGLCGFGGLGIIGGILHWPQWGVALLSAALLLTLPAWILALKRWPGRDRKAFGPRGQVLTLAAGLGNWGFQGAALFALAGHPIADFPGFLAAFCLGSLIGSAVGVPADLGVLEATVLGSHALGAAHQGAAALVLFRLIFQLSPLVLATGALAGRPLVKLAGKAKA